MIYFTKKKSDWKGYHVLSSAITMNAFSSDSTLLSAVIAESKNNAKIQFVVYKH